MLCLSAKSTQILVQNELNVVMFLLSNVFVLLRLSYNDSEIFYNFVYIFYTHTLKEY